MHACVTESGMAGKENVMKNKEKTKKNVEDKGPVASRLSFSGVCVLVRVSWCVLVRKDGVPMALGWDSARGTRSDVGSVRGTRTISEKGQRKLWSDDALDALALFFPASKWPDTKGIQEDVDTS